MQAETARSCFLKRSDKESSLCCTLGFVDEQELSETETANTAAPKTRPLNLFIPTSRKPSNFDQQSASTSTLLVPNKNKGRPGNRNCLTGKHGSNIRPATRKHSPELPELRKQARPQKLQKWMRRASVGSQVFERDVSLSFFDFLCGPGGP